MDSLDDFTFEIGDVSIKLKLLPEQPASIALLNAAYFDGLIGCRTIDIERTINDFIKDVKTNSPKYSEKVNSETVFGLDDSSDRDSSGVIYAMIWKLSRMSGIEMAAVVFDDVSTILYSFGEGYHYHLFLYRVGDKKFRNVTTLDGRRIGLVGATRANQTTYKLSYVCENVSCCAGIHCSTQYCYAHSKTYISKRDIPINVKKTKINGEIRASKIYGEKN